MERRRQHWPPDRATRASDPRKGLLHYQNRLKKAKRLVKLDKIEKFAGKIAKYKAICYGQAMPVGGGSLRILAGCPVAGTAMEF